MKRIAIGLLVVAALLVLATPALAAETATVRGSLSENATVTKAVSGAQVTVGGVPAIVTGQSYAATNVPTGQQLLVVSAPGHSRYTQTVEIAVGENVCDVVLNVTLKAMYTRYYEAYSHGHYRTAWRMMHPDVIDHLNVDGRRFTYTRYARFMSSWNVKWLSMRYLGIEETHRVWETKAMSGLQPTYPNVKCVEYLHRYVCGSWRMKETGNCHWLRESGVWYLIFDNPCLAM